MRDLFELQRAGEKKEEQNDVRTEKKSREKREKEKIR
jgi:hypothetical protein